MNHNTFKSVAFGGFDKQDVIHYIEQAAGEAAKAQELLQQETERLRDEVQVATAKQQAAELRISQLDQERTALQQELEETKKALEDQQHQREELERAREEWERARAELESQAKDAEALRPDAEAYAQFRERIGAIECEAHKRAADLEDTTAATLEKAVASFRAQYQSLLGNFDQVASYVTGELRKVEVSLTQLPRALDQTGVELKELSETLTKGADKEE